MTSTGFLKTEELFIYAFQKSVFGFSPNITRPVLAPQSSPIMTLAMIYAMGYQRVFLLGCDHNILKDYGGVVSNFYSPEKDMRKNATSGNNWEAGIISHLGFAKNVFLQYRYYQKVFDRSDRKIYNTSADGWLDFIEYYDFDNFYHG